MDGWNKDNAKTFYISVGGDPSDPVFFSGSKLDLMDAALNLENNKSQPKVWHTQHNQNNINQVEDVDRSSTLGKIIIGLVFLIILF